MALFDNNASGFASRLENIDKSGIIELTREVENLTKATADYEQKAEEAFSNGVALTKRQKDAYRDYETSVKATASAQKALREAIDATNAAWRGAKGADKKELAEKIGLYKELQKAVTDYKSGAQSALTAGAKVYNDKAVKRNVIQDATGQKNGEEVLPVEQIKKQSEEIIKATNDAKEATKDAIQPITANSSNQQKNNNQDIKGDIKGYTSGNQALDEMLMKYRGLLEKQNEYHVQMEKMNASFGPAGPNAFEAEQYKGLTKGWSELREPIEEVRKQINSIDPSAIEKLYEYWDKLAEQESALPQDLQEKWNALSAPVDTSWIRKAGMDLQDLKDTADSLKSDFVELGVLMQQQGVEGMTLEQVQQYHQLYEELETINNLIAKMEGKQPVNSPFNNGKNVPPSSPPSGPPPGGGNPPNGGDSPVPPELYTYQDLLKEIEETKKRILEAQVGSIFSDDIREDATSIKELQDHLKKLEAIKKTVLVQEPQGGAFDNEKKSFNELVDEIKQKQKDLEKAKTHLINSDNIEKDYAEIKKLEKEIQNLQNVLQTARSNSTGEIFANALAGALKSIPQVATNAAKGFSHFGDGFKSVMDKGNIFKAKMQGVGGYIGGAFGQAFAGLKGKLQAVGSVMKTVGSATKNVAQKGFGLLKKGAETAKSSIHGLIGRFKQLGGNTTKKLTHSLTSLKSMLMRRLKRTFISSIFNQAKEGLQNLAKFDSGFNQSMSNIKNAAQQTAGNLSGVLGNMVTILEPYITKVLNWLSELFAKVNAVLALFTGKSTIAVAKQGTDDYAKSLKNASGAAKDLNHQLYGFDEITRQEDNSGSGSSSGIQYETQEVSGILGDLGTLFENIKEAFLAGNFEEVGRLISEQLNNLTYTIDNWINEIRPKVVEWSSNIARILNGLVTEWDAYATGKLLADGLNLVFDTINTFLKTFDFFTLGVKLGEKIKGIFENVEWDLVGQTFGNSFNAVIYTIEGLVKNIPWKTIGKSLSTALVNMINTIDWNSAEIAFSAGINGIISMLDTFITGVDWAGLSEKILRKLDQCIDHIDWRSLEDLLKHSINNLIDIFGTLVSSDVIVHLGERLGTLVGNVLIGIDFNKLARDAKTGLDKIVRAFVAFIENVNLPGIGSKLALGINEFFDPNKKPSLTDIAKRATDGLSEIIAGFSTFIKDLKLDNIRKELSSSLKTLILQTDWDLAIANVVDGVRRLSIEFWKLIGDLFTPNENGESIGSKIANGINSLFKDAEGNVKTDMFKEMASSMSEGIKSVLADGKTLLENLDTKAMADSIKGWLQGLDWLGILRSTFETLGSFISKAFDAIGDILGAIIEYLRGLNWLEVAITIVKGISNMLWSAIQSVGGLIVKIIDALFGNIEKDANQLYVDEIADALKEQMGEAGQDAADSLWDSFNEQSNQGKDKTHEAVLEAASMIALGYQDKLKEGIADADVYNYYSDFAMDLLKAADPNQGGSLENIKLIWEDAGLTITDTFAEALLNMGKDDIGTAMMLLAQGIDQDTIAALSSTNLNEYFSQFMNETGATIEQVVAGLMVTSGTSLEDLTADQMADLEALAEKLGIEVGDNLGSAVPDALKKALLEGKVEVKKAADDVGKTASQTENKANIAKDAKDVGEETVHSEAEGMANKQGEVKDEVKDIHKSFTEEMESLPQEQKDQAVSMMNYIIKGIKEGDPLVQNAINSAAQAMIDKFKEILNSTQGMQIAKDFINGMWSEFNSDTSVANSMQYVAKTTRDTAMAYLNAINGMTIGGNMIIGMINGMNAYGTMLVMTIAKICNVSAQTARDILGIKSPSKVFAEIGEYTMEGMQIGLENEGKNAVNTVSDLAKAITEEGEGTTFGVMSNGLDVVADKLTRIADVFSDIADVITQMGGSLQIPTIAAGQTIPYRTQLGANGGSFSNGETLDATAIENAFYSAIMRAMENSDNSQNINVYLDGRQIADSVTKYQRRQARAMGV